MTEHAITQPALDADTLADLLACQQAVYERIAAQHEQQRAMFDSGELEQLAVLMHSRQKLVDRALQLNAALEPFRAQWTAFLAGLEQDVQQRVAAMVRRIADLQEQVIRQDAELAAAMQQSRQRMTAERLQVAAASRAVKAYRTPSAGTQRYTDREG